MPKIGNATQNQVTMSDYENDTGLTTIDSLRIKLESELSAELRKLDLSANEAKILLHLMSAGTSTASEISKNTRIQRTDTYHYISLLLSKGIVFSTFSKPQKYYSLSYEEAVDYLVRAKENALRQVTERKHDCQSMLEQISKNINEPNEESYQVLTGENILFTKIGKILESKTQSVHAFLTERMLARFYHEGLIDRIAEVAKRGGSVKLKTQNLTAIEQDSESEEVRLDFQIISSPSPASFLVVDGDKLVFIMDKNSASGREVSGIYTNNEVMVSTLRYLYEKIA